MGMVYDAVVKRVLYSEFYMNLKDVYTKPELWDAAVDGFDRGWKFDGGYYRVSPGVLEMILDPEAESSVPFPEEDLRDLSGLVVYGIAHPDAMEDTPKGVLERMPGLRHFAALNVVSCDTSFQVFADVDLSELQTVTIDVTETWGDIVGVEDGGLETDQVVCPWRMANRIKQSLERPDRKGHVLIFRHDVDHAEETSNSVTWLESADEYLRCPGAIFSIP
jgi:hypothetical protein